ncbi:MAG: hypothetical protein JKY23_01430 [Nitrospinaceae bacterium]|nr:hypothetical protein [Nitrospinaceae bacterium]
MSNIKLGIIREGKLPPDKRVPLIPQQCKDLLNKYSGLEIYVQPCEFRCYSDKEYEVFGIKLQEDLSNCDILMGVKEVPVEDLNAGKKYLFFSHTIKEQPYNKRLLQTILENNIQMIDYECLTGLNGFRVLGFGKYAGIVGAYNGRSPNRLGAVWCGLPRPLMCRAKPMAKRSKPCAKRSKTNSTP